MPRKRHGHQGRVDANQPAIVEALRAIPGVQVQTDKDDIMAGYKGVNYWFEIKDPEKCFNENGTWKKDAVKPGQLELQRLWPGQYAIVWNLAMILKIMGIQA